MGCGALGTETIHGRIRLGDWVIDPSANSLARGSRSVQIEPMVMDVLVCLANHSGEVVSRDTLIDEVWAGRAVSDEAVSRTIFLLRAAFRDCGEEGEIVSTVRKRGYRLEIANSHLKFPDLMQPRTCRLGLSAWLLQFRWPRPFGFLD